jgi:hypothetical protein
MTNERYVISERSGRLKKKIRIRRKRPVSVWYKLVRMVKKPWVVLTFILGMIAAVYWSMDGVAKKSTKSPVGNAAAINKSLNEKTGQ